MRPAQTRRAFLGALASAAGAGLAGCRSPGTTAGNRSSASTPGDEAPTSVDRTDSTGRYAATHDAVAGSVASVVVYDGEGAGGQGSAFVAEGGSVLTNEHVVSGADEVSVRFQDTGWREATVVATDRYSDLAVLDVPDLPAGADPLPFVAAEPPVGTEVVAIGNPFGYAGSLSVGVVSGVDRTLPAVNGFSVADAVQTDAAVNPGNSGGPLVTLAGEVVGVVNAGGGDNVGFAISAALTRRVVPELVRRGEYRHPYVGVTLTSVTPAIARANEVDPAEGVYIDRVLEDGPAAGALRGSTGTETVDGVRTPVGGDVVRALDGTPVPTRQALASVLALRTSPGDDVEVDLVREGEPLTVSLELGARPRVGP